MHIPGYRIIRKINHGGMSTVYLAIQESVGRVVALKIMSPILNNDPSYSERFQREANIVGQLSHPHIVSVYDIGQHNKFNYIAMDHLGGGSIHDKMLTGIAAESALNILKEIAAALDHAHNKGYIHRDIKPENILFRDDGSAVLTDFGVALAYNSSSRHTHAGTVVGTPHYMSPEQARGKTVDARSDLYSLGIVFYEMLTGSLPYQGDDAVSIALKHLVSPLPTLPAQFVRFQPIVDKLLNKEPDKRYQRGSELVADIDALQLHLRELGAAYLAHSQGLSDQFIGLFKTLWRKANTLIRVGASQLWDTIKNLRFTRSRGFYRRQQHTGENFAESPTREHTLVDTQIQRQLNPHHKAGLFANIKAQQKTLFWSAGLGAVFIAAMVTVALTQGPADSIGAPVAKTSIQAQADTHTSATQHSSQRATHSVKKPPKPVVAEAEHSLNSEPQTLAKTEREPHKSAAMTSQEFTLTSAADSSIDPTAAKLAALAKSPIKTPPKIDHQPDTTISKTAPVADKPARYRLTIIPKPRNARVRIMNIRQPYKAGIALTPGLYHIEVSHPGYRQYLAWVRLKKTHLRYPVNLQKRRPAGMVFHNRLKDGHQGPAMVVIPAGVFTMGGADKNSQPLHRVHIKKPFGVSQTEVTFAQYQRFAQEQSIAIPKDNKWGLNKRPVINVSWYNARAYAHWLSQQTGKHYRLPTEAEWEYVAKGGHKSAFWWGNNVKDARGRANCKRHCYSHYTGIFSSKTAPVGDYPANAYKVYDTAGNVAEWTLDCYRKSYKNSDKNGAAYSPKNCTNRVIRGGSFESDADEINVYRRQALPANSKKSTLGIRLVVELEH